MDTYAGSICCATAPALKSMKCKVISGLNNRWHLVIRLIFMVSDCSSRLGLIVSHSVQSCIIGINL